MNERFEAVNTPAEVRSLLLFSALNGDDPEGLRKRILSGFDDQHGSFQDEWFWQLVPVLAELDTGTVFGRLTSPERVSL